MTKLDWKYPADVVALQSVLISSIRDRAIITRICKDLGQGEPLWVADPDDYDPLAEDSIRHLQQQICVRIIMSLDPESGKPVCTDELDDEVYRGAWTWLVQYDQVPDELQRIAQILIDARVIDPVAERKSK